MLELRAARDAPGGVAARRGRVGVCFGTGAIIHGPLLKRFAFGLVCRDRHERALLADLPKLLGRSDLRLLSLGGTLLNYSCCSTFPVVRAAASLR